jgi:hypothetical protein
VLVTANDSSTKLSILRLRFPDGDVELRWNTYPLPVGVLVRSRGALWRVSRHDDRGAVILEVASPEGSAQYGPVVKPTPLGEESILLETIVAI